MNIEWREYRHGDDNVEHWMYVRDGRYLMGQSVVVYEKSRRYRRRGMAGYGLPWPKDIKTLDDMKKYIEVLVRMEGS